MSKEENNQTEEEWVIQMKDLTETRDKESICLSNTEKTFTKSAQNEGTHIKLRCIEARGLSCITKINVDCVQKIWARQWTIRQYVSSNLKETRGKERICHSNRDKTFSMSTQKWRKRHKTELYGGLSCIAKVNVEHIQMTWAREWTIRQMRNGSYKRKT